MRRPSRRIFTGAPHQKQVPTHAAVAEGCSRDCGALGGPRLLRVGLSRGDGGPSWARVEINFGPPLTGTRPVAMDSCSLMFREALLFVCPCSMLAASDQANDTRRLILAFESSQELRRERARRRPPLAAVCQKRSYRSESRRCAASPTSLKIHGKRHFCGRCGFSLLAQSQ